MRIVVRSAVCSRQLVDEGESVEATKRLLLAQHAEEEAHRAKARAELQKQRERERKAKQQKARREMSEEKELAKRRQAGFAFGT